MSQPIEPDLAAVDLRISIFEVRLAVPQALDLGSRQHDAGLDPLHQLVIVPRAAVARDDLDSRIVGLRRGFCLGGFLLGHRYSSMPKGRKIVRSRGAVHL